MKSHHSWTTPRHPSLPTTPKPIVVYPANPWPLVKNPSWEILWYCIITFKSTWCVTRDLFNQFDNSTDTSTWRDLDEKSRHGAKTMQNYQECELRALLKVLKLLLNSCSGFLQYFFSAQMWYGKGLGMTFFGSLYHRLNGGAKKQGTGRILSPEPQNKFISNLWPFLVHFVTFWPIRQPLAWRVTSTKFRHRQGGAWHVTVDLNVMIRYRVISGDILSKCHLELSWVLPTFTDFWDFWMSWLVKLVKPSLSTCKSAHGD
jgi:hypothetical protein